MMYQKLLVAMALDHDISQKLFSFARANCAEGGTITALHVVEELSGTTAAPNERGELQQARTNRSQALLDTKLADYPDVEGKLLEGHVATTLVEFADKIGADCIIMGSHKPGLVNYFIGSTAARVVRHANCSVHVFRDS